MICLTIVLIAIVFWFTLYLKSTSKDPPGPIGFPYSGIFPFIVLKSLFRIKQNENQFFKTMHEKYGDLWSFRSNNQRYIVLASADLQKEAFQSSGMVISGRPLAEMYQYVSKRRGVLSSDGDIWKLYRKITTKAFHEISHQSNKYEDIIQENVEKIKLSIDKSVKPIDTSLLFHSMTLAVIFKIVFNKDIEITDHRIKEYTDHVKVITNINLSLSNSVFFLTNIPLIKYTVPSTLRMRQAIDNIKSILGELWEETKENYQKNDINKECIGSYFIKQLGNLENNLDDSKYLNDFNFVQNFADLVSAGSDTVAATLTWCFLMLGKHKEIQNVLRNELIKFLDCRSINMIGYVDKEHLPYTLSFIEEIFRFFTIIPRTVHRPMMTTTFHGYTLTENDIVLGDAYAINHDPNVWCDHDIFRYDRFVNKDTKKIEKSSQLLIPFGVGKRSCIGETLARVEVFMTIVYLLDRYEIQLSNESMVDIENVMVGGNGLVFTPLHHKLTFQKIRSLQISHEKFSI